MPTPHHAKNLRFGRFSGINRIYHITVTTIGRQAFFQEWSDALPLINTFKQAQKEGEARSLCWVVMPDHIHWLIELQTNDLSRVIGRMKSRSTLGLNRHFGRTGPIWQKGFHDHALRKEENLKTVARYIIANPLRAGLVKKVGDYL